MSDGQDGDLLLTTIHSRQLLQVDVVECLPTEFWLNVITGACEALCEMKQRSIGITTADTWADRWAN